MFFSKSYVYLTLYGENFSPSEFTQLMNLKPTDFGIKGEKGKFGSILKECFWNYHLNETNALEGIEESLERMIDIFREKKSLIKNYIQKNYLKVKCFVVIKSKNNEDNGVALSSEIISFLDKLSASIEINVYNT